MQFDIGMLFVVIGFSTYSPNTCYRIKYKNNNCKISKIPMMCHWTHEDSAATVSETRISKAPTDVSLLNVSRV
jgi:hypothetical protein